MKRRFNTYVLATLALVAGSVIYMSCSDMEKEFDPDLVKYPEFTVTGFSPASGRPGTAVTITGTHFGEYAQAAKVAFNGVNVETFVSYTDNEMVVLVPDDAGTGPITLSVWTHTENTAEEFNYVPGAVVASIAPADAAPGDQVTITGEHFGTDQSDIHVFFRENVEAEIVSLSDTEIVVTVPAGGMTGAITLQAGPQTLTGPVFSYPLVGVDAQFETDGDAQGWQPAQNSTFTVSGGKMNVTFDPAQFGGASRRADLQLVGGTKIDVGSFPIIAIKLKKPGDARVTFDTDFGAFGNGYNKWTGILIGDVYYFDMSKTGFGAANTMLSQTEPTTFTNFQFKIADITTAETGYSVDWIRSFENMQTLQEAVALPEGQYIFEFDDPNTSEWMTGQSTPFTVEDGKFKTSFLAAQFEGTAKRRADFYYIISGKFPQNGDPKASWVYTPEYPIIAFKIAFTGTGSYKPGTGNLTLDPYGGGNNIYKTDFAASHNVIYYDMSTKYTTRTELATFQLKIADITSAEETGYEMDWVRTFKSVDELNAFLNN